MFNTLLNKSLRCYTYYALSICHVGGTVFINAPTVCTWLDVFYVCTGKGIKIAMNCMDSIRNLLGASL